MIVKTISSALLIYLALVCTEIDSFSPIQSFASAQSRRCIFQSCHDTFTFITQLSRSPCYKLNLHRNNPLYTKANIDNDMMEDDASLLESVSMEQLEDLCSQYSISLESKDKKSYSKADLLSKLRAYAAEQAELDKQRQLSILEKAKEEGVINIDDVEDIIHSNEMEGTFFYAAPESKNATKVEEKASKVTIDENAYKQMNSHSKIPTTSHENNNGGKKNGERVVTIYNSKDTNDLTGFNLGSTPGQAFANAATTLGSAEGTLGGGGASTTAFLQSQNQNQNQNNIKLMGSSGSGTHHNMEEAEDKCIALIQTLLIRTNLPGFLAMAEEDPEIADDDDDEIMSFGKTMSTAVYAPFDPSSVPTQLLQQYTSYILAHDGRALRAALDQVELNAIGHDGMNADDIKKNGGHYRETRKVGVFLEGYRVAEVRRVSRETVSSLLDALVSGGVRELDRIMNGMVQAGVIDDGLVDYLSDLVRQQEKRVQQYEAQAQQQQQQQAKLDYFMEGAEKDLLQLEKVNDAIIEWNKTKDSNGQIIQETIDPNNPEVRAVVMESKSNSILQPYETNNHSAQQKILVMLQLLKERVKAEAAFFKLTPGTETQEHGMNLRRLAYCINAKSDMEREQILNEELGSSMDKLDSFLELVRNSIEFAESASSELIPGKKPINLNLSVLKQIESIGESIRELQTFQAAGGSLTSGLLGDSLVDADNNIAI